MSNIKINDVPQRIQYSATGGQTQFTIPFPFFQNSFVYVWLNGIQIFQGGAPGQYVVTGAGSPSGGLVTFNSAATLNDIVTIEGIMPIDRTSIYSATISNLTGSDLNGDFNREVVMLQQLNTTQSFMQLQYAPWALISQDLTVTKDRYIPLLPALGAWRMNAGGTAIETFQTPSSGGLAPDDGTYLLQVADADLPNAQVMGDLVSGFVVNTTTTGVQLTRLLEAETNELAITNPSGIGGNPVYGFAPNARFPGTEGLGIVRGTTAQRPVTPVGTNLRFNTDLIINEYWDGSSWVQLSETDGVVTAAGTLNQILVNGGIAPVDGATIFSLSPTLDLPGSFNIQGTNAVTAIINDATMASATTSNLSSSLAIKQYVDSLVTGLNIQGSCVCASTVALTVTYSNGVAGVGATLTNAGVQAAISLDGVSPTVGQRVLIKNQASTLQNGIYTVTNVGSGATNWVLTRATDYDTPSEVSPGDLVILTGGSTQNQSSWVETATVTAIGTDPITFVQFTASLPVNVPSGGTGVTSFTAYAPIVGGTTTTGSLQSVGLGAAGTLYQSAGVGALPGFTTATFPSTTTINQLLYSSANNTIAGLPTVNSAGLLTNGSGVPAFVAYTGSGAPVLANTPTLITPNIGAATADSITHNADTNNQFVFGTDTQDFITGGSSRMDISDTGFRLGGANARVTTILSDATLAAAANTNMYTGLALKTYIDNANGGQITPWVAYTPTFTGFGTVSNVQIWSRRVGDVIEIRGRFQGGTTTATEGRISLGYNGTSGNIASSTSTISSIQQAAGYCCFGYNSTPVYCVLIESNSTYMTFGVQASAFAGLTKLNGNDVLLANNVMSFTCRIAVDSWP